MEIADKIFRLVCSKSHQCIALNLDISPHKRRVAQAWGKLIRVVQKVCEKNACPILIPGKLVTALCWACYSFSRIVTLQRVAPAWLGVEALWEGVSVRVNLTFRIKTSVCRLASTDSVVTTHFVSILIAKLWNGCDEIIKVWCTNQASVLYGNVKLCFFCCCENEENSNNTGSWTRIRCQQ